MFEERIKLGMALLDEKVPGWREKINLGELNMLYGSNCILGQVFGHYSRKEAYDVVPAPLRFEHGFVHLDADAAKQLTSAWKAALSQP